MGGDDNTYSADDSSGGVDVLGGAAKTAGVLVGGAQWIGGIFGGDGSSGSASGPVTPAPGGIPGAVPVAPQAWNLDASPATYVLQPGDTLTGLALTYLGSPDWSTIWAMQSPTYKASRTPSKIYAGDVLKMPENAANKARALLGKSSGPKKGGGKATQVDGSGSAGAYVAGGVTLLGLGVALYDALR